VLSLLFAGTTVNYLDRIVLSVLLPEIEKEISISPVLYGIILGSFQITYTLGLLGAGFVIDKLGTKLGYLISIISWSISSTFHGLCSSGLCLAAWRAVFGLAASGNFPSAIKSVSEWFKVENRAFATALFNSGSSISSIIGAPLIVACMVAFGWRSTFVVFGLSGLVLAAGWQLFYKKPDKSQTEGPHLQIRWSYLLRQKRWAL